MGYDIFIEDESMQGVNDFIDIAATCQHSVLILGESGTGKEIIARTIHEQTESTKDNSFIAINCGAIPADMIENELFGHMKGAYTGATSNEKGKFELANNGTLFLDEVGDMPFDMQVKILRAVQEKEGMRIGGNKLTLYNFRLICATHRDLKRAIIDNRFREDLFYRITVLEVTIPPLRARKKDISKLANIFWNKYCLENKKNPILSDEVLKQLSLYRWPGNIRQLENEIKRLFAYTSNGESTKLKNCTKDIIMPQENNYHPNPLDVSTINLPSELRDLMEKLAENAHDIWAKQRILDGWSWGEKRDDDALKHPDLVPYQDLPDSEKEYDRIISESVIKYIIKSGYNLDDTDNSLGSLNAGTLNEQCLILEHRLIKQAIKQSNNNKSEAAKTLGKSRKWLFDRLKYNTYN